jgi:DNA-binding NarL/FixJ family response regulator
VLKTLIVEDSSFFRQLLKETLISQFPWMEISEATNSEEALQKTKTLLPDLVFLDIKLPGESGLEVTKRIKTEFPDIIVIILTSYDLPEYREAAKEYKANYFLSKGSTTKEGILSLVQSILSNRSVHFNNANTRRR